MNMKENMTNDTFVERIKDEVRDASVEVTLKNLVELIGRSPRDKNVRQKEWYDTLNDSDRDMVRNVITEAVDETVFGFLCVLDGVRTIDDEFDEEGKFVLEYTNRDYKSLINDEEEEFLHDIYQGMVDPLSQGN